jgi:hypothetical protein
MFSILIVAVKSIMQSVVMLYIVMLIVFKENVVTLCVVMLSVIMLSVMINACREIGWLLSFVYIFGRVAYQCCKLTPK